MSELREICLDNEYYYVDKLGRKQGVYLMSHPNDELRIKAYYVDDELHGEYKEWYKNGQIRFECNYINGRKAGLLKGYYRYGQIHVISCFVNGFHHGERKRWRPSGELGEQEFYNKDIDITEEVASLVKDIKNLTDEDKTLIKLKWGIACLD